MPMIDVTAPAGLFADKHALAVALSQAVMRWEGVPDLALFRDNTATFIHELDPDAFGTAGIAGWCECRCSHRWARSTGPSSSGSSRN